MNRPATLAELARRIGVDPDGDGHIPVAGFLDNFYMNPAARQGMIDPEPPLLGIGTWDAMLGAMGEHLARRWDLRLPPWIDQPERFLKEPCFPTPLEGLKPMLIAQSPLAFRRRLIFVEREPLSRARMPRG